MITSLNGKIICEPYSGGKGIKSEVKSGFAVVKRKELVGLKVLVHAHIVQGDKIKEIPVGSTVYITEENLTINQTYSSPMENEAVGAPFIVAEYNHVVMVKNP